MTVDEMKVFLALAEELHFGRTAERLYLPQPRVSRLIVSLEREVGGTLFERSTRRVRLTPLGRDLRDRLRPAYQEMLRALAAAKAAAQAPDGVLRIGFTASTEGQALNRLVGTFTRNYPTCHIEFCEAALFDPYRDLRGGEIDVLVNWSLRGEPDLTYGPLIDLQERVLLVAADHPVASKDSVSVEILADFELASVPPTLPESIRDTFIPPATPAGKPTRRTVPIQSMSEAIALIASGRIAHPTVTSMAEKLHRADIALVSIHDLPPVPLGLVWCTAHENARIRAFADTAATLATRWERQSGPPSLLPS
jgi:DNA-binding transcriptional LysR family regulator